MADENDTLLMRVRADTTGFARDVAAMRASLEGPLSAGADRAGRAIESALLRAVRTGKLGFDDLKRVALSALAEIASTALRSGIDSILGGAPRSNAPGLSGLLGGLLGGHPGRATGGPVSPGRAYVVGERGPELFVPTTSGRVAASGAANPREVRVAITIAAPGSDAPTALARSSRQVARAVKAALSDLED